MQKIPTPIAYYSYGFWLDSVLQILERIYEDTGSVYRRIEAPAWQHPNVALHPTKMRSQPERGIEPFRVK